MANKRGNKRSQGAKRQQAEAIGNVQGGGDYQLASSTVQESNLRAGTSSVTIPKETHDLLVSISEQLQASRQQLQASSEQSARLQAENQRLRVTTNADCLDVIVRKLNDVDSLCEAMRQCKGKLELFLSMNFHKLMDPKATISTFRLIPLFVSTYHPEMYQGFCDLLTGSCLALFETTVDPLLTEFPSEINLSFYFGDVKVIKTNVIEATIFPEDEELLREYLQIVVDLHVFPPKRQLVMNKTYTYLTPMHILMHTIKLLNIKGVNVEGILGEFPKYCTGDPDYTVLDSNGIPCMLLEFEEYPLIYWDMYQVEPEYENFATKMKNAMERLVKKMIRGKSAFGALVDCTVAFMIELDLARFEMKKDQNDRNLQNIPINICKVTEHDIHPSYLQVIQAWIIRSVVEMKVKRYEIERLNLEGFYGL